MCSLVFGISKKVCMNKPTAHYISYWRLLNYKLKLTYTKSNRLRVYNTLCVIRFLSSNVIVCLNFQKLKIIWTSNPELINLCVLSDHIFEWNKWNLCISQTGVEHCASVGYCLKRNTSSGCFQSEKKGRKHQQTDFNGTHSVTIAISGVHQSTISIIYRTNVLPRTSFSDWLCYSLIILLWIVCSLAVCACWQTGGCFFAFSKCP